MKYIEDRRNVLHDVQVSGKPRKLAGSLLRRARLAGDFEHCSASLCSLCVALVLLGAEGYASPTAPSPEGNLSFIHPKEVNMSTAPTPALTDPIKVDPKHYSVESENDRVRVLRVTYGPREKSVMHSHPASLAVFLTANRARFTFPDGKTQDRNWKAGDTMSSPAETHLPENLSNKPLKLILVEFK